MQSSIFSKKRHIEMRIIREIITICNIAKTRNNDNNKYVNARICSNIQILENGEKHEY